MTGTLPGQSPLAKTSPRDPSLEDKPRPVLGIALVLGSLLAWLSAIRVATADDLTAQVPLALLPTFVIYRYWSWQLQTEKEKNEIKEVELQKKETLYLRTMAARKSIQDSFNEQREQIAKVEASMERMEVDRQELLKVIQGKDGHIRELEEDLRRAKKRIAEMEQQRDMALQEFRDETGRILDLSSFKVAPTLS
eukprot:s1132_g18.t2